jgi:hypothetical protein
LGASAIFKRAASLALPVVFCAARVAGAQELAPGAYTPAPVGFNIVTLGASFNSGGLAFDPTFPVEGAHAKLGAGAIGYGRTFRLAGRFANLGGAVPYINGTAEGVVFGQFQQRHLSGAGDPIVRFGVNLFGARAMTPKEFAGYRARVLVGVSLTASLPLGQYNNDRYINIGRNRWAFKPEVGVSTTRGHWTLEGDFGAGFFTDNTDYVGGKTLAQAPIASAQGHVIYTIRFGFWVAFDANYWHGGRITTNGVEASTSLSNSRVGITAAIPFFKRQIRVNYSDGWRTALGGDFKTIGVSYSHAWK